VRVPPRSRAAAKLVVSAVAIALLAWRVDLTAVGAALAQARLGLLAAAFGLYLLGQALSACRWWLISRRVGFVQGPTALIRYYVIAMFFNLFGPSTLGGDVVRAMYLAGSGGRRAAALHTVIFDRLCGLVMLIMVLLLAMVAFGRFGLPAPVFAAVAAAGAAIVAAWWTVPYVAARWLRPENRIRRLIELEVGPFWRDRRLLAEVSTTSVVMHVWQIAAAYMVTVAAGVEVPWQYCFVFHPLVSILAALPISLAGLGVREAGYVYFLAAVQHVPEANAVAFGLLWLGVLLGSSVVGGATFLLDGGAIPHPVGTNLEEGVGDRPPPQHD